MYLLGAASRYLQQGSLPVLWPGRSDRGLAVVVSSEGAVGEVLPADFPFMRDTWDFWYVQSKEEWLRYIGMRRLPFETEWLLVRLV